MVTRRTGAWIAAAPLAPAVGLAVRRLGSGPFRLEIGALFEAARGDLDGADSFSFRAARPHSGIGLPLSPP